jgi:solute carrier family 50 (sugar transporter)
MSSSIRIMSSSPSSFIDLCGKLAPLASIVVFLAPMPTIQQIKRDKTVSSLPLLPYSTMIMSAFLWAAYGILIHQANVWATNALGFGFGVYYWYQFVQYAPLEAPTLPGSVARHQQAIAATVVATATTLVVASAETAKTVIGSAAVALCLAMFGSPLAALKTVLATKSAKSIPWPFTIASMVNCFLWSVFGFFKMNDPNVYLTNALGLSFGLVQAALKLIYKDHGKPITSLPL